MSKLNDAEKEFIELSLGGREGVELQESETSLSIVRKDSSNNKKPRSRRKLSYLITAVFALPFILTGIFMGALIRVQSFVGGRETLDWLAKQQVTPEMKDIVTEVGFDWLPAFLDVYNNRGIIVALVFTICFLAVAALILYDVNRNKTDPEDDEPEDAEES